MSTGSEIPEKPSSESKFISILKDLLRWFLRLVLIVVVLVALGAAVWFGVPALYNYFIRPVEQNAQNLNDFQSTQELANQKFTQALATLDVRRGMDATAVMDLQGSISKLDGTLQARLGTDESNLTATLKRLQDLDASLSGLGTKQASSALDSTGQLATVEALATAVQGANPQVEALRQEVKLVKAMEFITRSRLFLAQNNLGLAQNDIRAARDLLASLQPEVPSYQKQALAAIVSRLNLAQGELPNTPVVAADDLEIAWQMLVAGLPGEGQTGTPTLLNLTATITSTVSTKGTVTPSTTLTPKSKTPTP
jgi:hypothetical protein